MADVDPLTESWTPIQIEVMQRLRDWAAGFGDLNRHLAVWMRLPASDAHALGQITWAAEAGTPLSPVELSRRIAMTTGATTILLNRLEDAGHVQRSRESSDRRRVTLRPTPAAREHARRFLTFAGAEIAATLRAADPEELRVVTTFLSKITEAAESANRRLEL
ncbi:MarR family winged helix-turn-helix transcriptional regulator [Amycolatopsis alba]|uniref:MarR family transcriptional regulator n=1 Tax=Amycolatopsis alba DSM 44262 TaxID=1125972 RepID=A0A229RFD5_AMYAL|nr:MarR family winged helix-turn-helix transcriptional regulator [Amycolatopsis alba]OXM45366.1 MarR family transcriptional regulator [Amycolatopsis alba DSM 44262]